MNEKTIADIKRYGKTARGQKELLKHLSGQKLTFKQAVFAKCYDCADFSPTEKLTVICLNVRCTRL